MNTSPFNSATQSSAEARQHLVDELVSKGTIRTAAIRKAFEAIPRERFVPFFYERDEAQKQKAWTRYDVASTQDYTNLIYRDDALVTQVNERGWPSSSSSMPTVMALMLEALDIQPGQRILEIGVGTGYNAAIMTMLTGDPRLVTSIEIDEGLAQQAQQALLSTVGPVNIVTGDGYQGYPEHAPYDRIISTASVPLIPPAWTQQLAPGGRLVTDLHGSLASGFLIMEKAPDGTISGHFQERPLHFMPLITEQLPQASFGTVKNLLQEPRSELFPLDTNSPFPAILENHSYRWFLQWFFPNTHISRQNMGDAEYIYLYNLKHRTILRFQQLNGKWAGDVHGAYPLWQKIQDAYATWEVLKRPAPQHYRLEINARNQTILYVGTLSLLLTRTKTIR
ncbi:rRNA adenine N-6-methyltransferase family protein [Dictyobacter aurantiacus]|uniref:Protein-L-isoaspartate O-methyltransferase n=1 Tax=Dictyobacter aurantiacus TaxID=1936993 RepID=A0A401ZRS1_9CHLR|nr:rRNA adenine N-6-methyltransferase family protein [Dictyobacter aurantiacus]GCE09484.1 protein-L-isoaspartate O-methyltransferase [Dictyobacter aurantiacus]